MLIKIELRGRDAKDVPLRTSWIGRAFAWEPDTDSYVDPYASRFTPESISGLVVGAMGVFVFSVALGHWLSERLRFRERSEEA